MRCNWKVALEAFIESFHVTTTHPQALPWGGDVNTQYDIYPGQELWNRMITLAAVPSPVLGDEVDQQDIADTLYHDLIGGPGSISVPEGGTARQAVAQAFRSMLRETMGVDVSGVTDCQVLDTIEYFFFPNFVTFIGVLQSLTYRFRPLGNDPDRSIMEIMLLAPLPEGAPRPPAAPVHWLGVDDLWTAAPELGNFAPFLNQDLSNVNRVQRGLHSATKTGVTLADYQEVRIRHFHQMLDDYINSDSCQE
jgi:phenylpropionate dioxygenase-like ring-hydroxylating dioxygenase large terminal subunit